MTDMDHPESLPNDASAEINPRTAHTLPARRNLSALSHSRRVSRPEQALAAVEAPATRRDVQRGTAKKRISRGTRTTAIMALAVPGLLASVGIPAAFAAGQNPSDAPSSATTTIRETGSQSLVVADDVVTPEVEREGYTATTSAELAAAVAAEEAVAAATARAAAQEEMTATLASNKTAKQVMAEASSFVPNGSGQSQVFQVALQYQGVPYVFGGATPSGFDCSGFVKYVYAKFGKAMPHSSTAQGNMGTPIPLSQAVPGDLLVKPGHIGFYAGNGKILHASQPGVPLKIGPMYGNYQAVRLNL